MKIITNSNTFRIFDIANTYEDLYFSDIQASARAYSDSIVITDLTNAMRPGKVCLRWVFHVSRSHREEYRLCPTEYVEMAASEADTLAELMQLLRSGAPLTEVDGLTVERRELKATRTFSPFAMAKPVKLGEHISAAQIAKAILAGQFVSGRTEARYTDDYALDAAYDFYAGEIDLVAFAADIYEDPHGWSFWWKDEARSEVVAALHTFDYKTLVVA